MKVKRTAVLALALALLFTGCGTSPTNWDEIKAGIEKYIEEGQQEQSNGENEHRQDNEAPQSHQNQNEGQYVWRQETQGNELINLLKQTPLYARGFDWKDDYSEYIPDFFTGSWTVKNYIKSYDFMTIFRIAINEAVENVYNYPLGIIPGSVDLQALFIPAADVEDELTLAVDMLYGDDLSQLKNSDYYDKSRKVYLYPQGYGGEGVDYLEVEKAAVIGDYMVLIRRCWSDWQRGGFSEKPLPTDEGAVTVLYKDGGDTYYHYLSNYRVKNIDRYLQDSSVSNSTVQKPASTENEILKHVTAEDGLRLRTGAGTDYDTIYTLPYGCPVIVLHSENDWCFVEFNGTLGWMSSGYLEE